jgi:hypothetical protein
VQSGSAGARKSVAGAITALALLFGAAAAPANADNKLDYLQQVQKELPDIYNQYGPQKILTEGYRICEYGTLGMDLTSEFDRIVTDMPMPRWAALRLKSVAEVFLDCQPY